MVYPWNLSEEDNKHIEGNKFHRTRVYKVLDEDRKVQWRTWKWKSKRKWKSRHLGWYSWKQQQYQYNKENICLLEPILGVTFCVNSYLKQVPINKLGYFGGEIETVLKSWKWNRKEIQKKILIFIEFSLKLPTIRSVGNGEGNSLFLRKRFCILNPHEQITDLIELINCFRLVTYLAI